MATAYRDGGTGIGVGGGADVAFTPGAAGRVDADVAVLWDFDNDGNFNEPEEDITSYVLSAESSLGRDFPSQINGKASPGQLSLTLDNTDNRFSFFNQASPLNTGPFSLSTGRKVRVRAATATDNEPVMLTKDRFNRTDVTLDATETGLPWASVTTPQFDVANNGAVATSEGDIHIAVIDVGTADCYVQVAIRQTGMVTSGAGNNRVGIVYRYQDASNYSMYLISLTDFTIGLYNVVAGVESVVAFAPAEVDDGMTLGLMVVGEEVYGFLDGVQVPALHSVALQLDETEFGLYARWGGSNLRPEFDNFYVWEPLPDENTVHVSPGTLFTGYVADVLPDVQLGPHKTCTVKAEGVLSMLADQEVTSPRYVFGQGTGYMCGRVLSEARPFDPPGRVLAYDRGKRATGPVSFPDDRGNALEFLRRFEDHELGFLCEAPEGHVEFDEHTHRASHPHGLSPSSTWSDDAGAQFGYKGLELLSWSRELVNRVEGGIAPIPATGGSVLGSTHSTGPGTPSDLNVAIPADAKDGELFVFLVSSTVVASASSDWPIPLWWVPERRDIQPDARGVRIFTHISNGTDGGDNVLFYDDTGNSGGSHIWFMFRYGPGDWYGAHEGIHLAEFQKGDRPPVADPPWGAVPTNYIAIRAGFISTGGAAIGATAAPVGFQVFNSEFINGIGTNAFDNALQYAIRGDNVGLIKPTSFEPGTLAGFLRVESAVLMIRGHNGDPPIPSGVVRGVVDNVASQDRHNAVRTYQHFSDLFVDDDQIEEFAEDMFALHADDRPLFRFSFTATQNAGYRAQALARRVGDRITLVANSETGMGVSGDFYIERVENRWSDGGKLWEVTWDVSPAPARTVVGPVS